MKLRQRISLVFTPAVLDGICMASLFISIFAVILIPHLLAYRGVR